ncbi:related to membrane protein Dik6 [Ustilago trichophora]|uniref:Related to membrane protein Dik6 n=1 Tax=Ustilago trichophora TaxID=86804 RepID=A0A5C3EBN9_9BASI|nr:related to membrane protein Dik6 [Ustilago trichophora]
MSNNVAARLMRPITPEELHYPYPMETNAQLIDFANLMLRPPPSKAVEVFMIIDIIQCIITLIGCAHVVVKKGRMRDVEIFKLRKSPYGTFIVPNAVWVLLTGVSYGFVLTCSPRSPISNLSGYGKLRKMHLPIPHSAALMNTIIIAIGLVMVGWNVVITSLNGHQRNLTHMQGRNVYEILLRPSHTQAFLDAAPTEEMLTLVKLGWCDVMNVFRWCCIALGSFIMLVVMIIVLLAFWSIPNHLFLVDNLCSIFPDAIAEKKNHRNAWDNLVMLWRIGLPKNLKGVHYAAFKRTWMMTMVGHSQALLLLGGVVSFTVPPVFLFFVPWTNAYAGRSSDHQVMFIVAYVITVAFLLAGWITGLSATLTFDDIFRAVSGLGNEHTGQQSQLSSDTHSSCVPQGSRAINRKFSGANILPPSPTKFNQPSSPNLLRPMPSFTPSSSSEQTLAYADEKALHSKNNTNNVLIVTETSIHVDHHDLEASLSGSESIPMYPHPYNSNRSPSTSDINRSSNHFLGRNMTRYH